MTHYIIVYSEMSSPLQNPIPNSMIVYGDRTKQKLWKERNTTLKHRHAMAVLSHRLLRERT